MPPLIERATLPTIRTGTCSAGHQHYYWAWNATVVSRTWEPGVRRLLSSPAVDDRCGREPGRLCRCGLAVILPGRISHTPACQCACLLCSLGFHRQTASVSH